MQRFSKGVLVCKDWGLNQEGQVVLLEQILQGLYTAGMSHLLIYVWSIRSKIISSFDPALMWLGTINSTLIVLTDAMTEPLVISAYQC